MTPFDLAVRTVDVSRGSDAGNVFGTLVWVAVGVVIVFGIAFAICRQMGFGTKWLYVAGLVALLLLAIIFFFGAPRGW